MRGVSLHVLEAVHRGHRLVIQRPSTLYITRAYRGDPSLASNGGDDSEDLIIRASADHRG